MIRLKITNTLDGNPCVRFNKSSVYPGVELLTIVDEDSNYVDCIGIENYVEVPVKVGYTYVESMESGLGSMLELTAVNINEEFNAVEFDCTIKPVTRRLRDIA